MIIRDYYTSSNHWTVCSFQTFTAQQKQIFIIAIMIFSALFLFYSLYTRKKINEFMLFENQSAKHVVEKKEHDTVKCEKIDTRITLPHETFELAQYYESNVENKNLILAFQLYQKAVEANFLPAFNELGRCYVFGIGVESNPMLGLKYIKTAAEQGDVLALSNLGFCYEAGVCVKQNLSEAIRFYLLAAEKGCTVAQCNLAVIHFFKEKQSVDKAQAAFFLKQAAEKGNLLAQEVLAQMYYNGQIGEKDFKEAFKWFYIAEMHGSTISSNWLRNLETPL